MSCTWPLFWIANPKNESDMLTPAVDDTTHKKGRIDKFDCLNDV